jgi:hypothetical protein
MNNPIVLIEINQIEREKQSQGMDSSGRHHPYPFIGPESEPPD